MQLEGKVAIITGAGRGLGRSSAIAMSREGADLVILSRTESEISGTAEVIKSLGRNVLAFAADVSKPMDVEKIVNQAGSVFGRIDILMNNAAVGGPVKPLAEVEIAEWDSTMDANLKGAFLLSRMVIPYMIKGGGGKIINVTSGLAEMVMPPLGMYSVTKAGLNHFTRILAVELARYNIQVNGLDPGVLDTRMQEDMRLLGPDVLGEDVHAEFTAMKEKGYLKSPDAVANLAVFLSSSESDRMTGKIGTEDFFSRYGYEKAATNCFSRE